MKDVQNCKYDIPEVVEYLDKSNLYKEINNCLTKKTPIE